MEVGDQQRMREDTYKAVTLCIILIICISVPLAIYINQHFEFNSRKQNDAVEAFHHNLMVCNDDVLKCKPEAELIDLLDERMRTRSFPLVQLCYVVVSFLFLAMTLQLNLAQVSMLVWGFIVLGNFVSIYAIGGAR